MGQNPGVLRKGHLPDPASLAKIVVSTFAACLLLAGCALGDQFASISGTADTPEPQVEATTARVKAEADKPAITAAPTTPVMTEPQNSEMFPGSGKLFQPLPTHASTDTSPEGDITLNFVNVSIPEVARGVLGEVLSLNYVVAPEVTGRVTIQTSRPIARSAVLPTLEEALRLSGAALIKKNGTYTIAPLRNAQLNALPSTSNAGARTVQPGYGTHIVPLRFIGATEMQNLLSQITQTDAVKYVDTRRNLLILSGPSNEISTLLDAIDMFDVDWMDGMSFGLYHLTSVDVNTILQELDPIYSGLAKGPLAGTIRLVPIKRLNAILAITPQPKQLETLQQWITRLDRTPKGGSQRLFIYFVQNGRAADLAAVLTQVFANGQSALAVAQNTAPQVSSFNGLQGDIVEPPQTSTAPGRAISIVADEQRNALLISANASEYRMIETALHELDTAPLQVLLEATIAEVTLTDELQYGLQWFFRQGSHEVTLSEAASGAVASNFPGFSYFFSVTDASVALSALSDITDINIISSPQLMVLNNQTAMLQVGDQVPVATQSAVDSTNTSAPIVNAIQFRDTGIILRVTPRVNENGLVILDIEQEVSEVTATTTSTIDSPTIQQRRITSTIAAQDGMGIALGGLIKDTKSKAKAGLPVLSDLPILGPLFGTTTDSSTRTELLVLVVPRVARNFDEAARITEDLRQRIRAIAPLEGKID